MCHHLVGFKAGDGVVGVGGGVVLEVVLGVVLGVVFGIRTESVNVIILSYYK